MIDPLRSGDVILTSEAPMGEMLFIANRSNFLLSQRLFGVRINTEKCSGLFLYFWLQTPQAKRDMEGRATGTTVLGIKLSELIRVSILCVPRYSLNKFNSLIFPIMAKLESKEVENEINQELIKIVLSKMSKIETLQTEQAI
jgi:type I restriction enzyme S subunit